MHLSSEGSKIVVKEILKVLKEADWEPSLYFMSLKPEYVEYSPSPADGKITLDTIRKCFNRNSHWEI